MRICLFLGCLLGCGRTVNYLPLESGSFTADELNTPSELRGIRLTLNLAENWAELKDGDITVRLLLTRRPDRKSWVGGCGTMSSYAMLEAADVSPRTVTLRGQTFDFDYLRAPCYAKGVWLSTSHSGDRLIFSPP